MEANTETDPMNPTGVPESSGNQAAATSVAEAHQLLKALQEQVGKHPVLEEAIVKLELALSALTIQTGGLL
jgi:tRNA U34 5-methylaminomethyl-2-thiouridine-forming methyltransferase MnmC